MNTVAPDVRPAEELRHNRNFSLLWFGEGVSVLGNATTSVLLPLLAVVTFDAGPEWMGVLAAATWLPWLLVGLPAGAWVDQLPSRAVMIGANLLAAAAVGSVPLAWLLGLLSLYQLFIVALVAGVATVFFRAAYAGFVPQIVPADQLEKANARLFGTESAMQTVGPGVGGLIAQWLAAATGLLIDAVSFLVSAICLWRIRPSVPATPPSIRSSLRLRIAEGVRFVRRDRYLRWLVLIGGASNAGLTGYAALLVVYLVRDLGLSASTVGLVIMIGSSGGLVGAALAPAISARIGSGRASTVLLVLGGPPALLLPLSAPGWRTALVVAGLFAVGVCVVAGNVIRGAWRQRYVPATLIGRVLTTSQFVNYGTMPIAAVTAGLLGGQIGVRETIALMAAIHVAASLAILISPFRGLTDLPDHPDRTDWRLRPTGG